MTAAADIATWSLRRRLAQGLVLAALLPTVLLGAALLWGQWKSDREALLLRLDANARQNASLIDDFLDAQMAGVRLLADRIEGDAGTRDNELARLLYVYPTMLRAVLVDARGQVLAVRDTRGRTLPTNVHAMAGEDWFKVARDQYRANVSDVFRRPVYGSETVVAVAAPMLRGRRFEGVLQAEIPVDTIARVSAESLARRNLEFLLLDRGNHVVYAGQGLRWRVLEDAGPRGDALRRMARGAEYPGRTVLLDDVLRNGGMAYVNAVSMRNGWTLVLVAPRQLLLAPMLPRLVLLVGMLAVTLAGVVWAILRQRKLLRVSIGGLLASLRGYALGGRLEPVSLSGMPEELWPLSTGMGELAARMNAAFDEVQRLLQQREEVIAERTASLRQAVGELDRLSRTDALTGCLNYRGFVETGERLWREASATARPLSVLALDIDHFKRYNDRYGHAEGDGALRRFAGAVRSALLHPDDVLARPGGEEFTVFLPDSSAEQAMRVGQRVCQRVRDADIAHADAEEGRLTVSVGVATQQPGDACLEDLLKRADAALYRAKAGGRNRSSD